MEERENLRGKKGAIYRQIKEVSILYNLIGYITLLLGLEVLKALVLILYNTVLSLTLNYITRLTVIFLSYYKYS